MSSLGDQAVKRKLFKTSTGAIVAQIEMHCCMRQDERKKLCYARAVLWEADASKSEKASRYGDSLRKHFQLPSAIPKPLRLHPDSIQHGEVKVRHRCTPRHLDMLS